MELLWIFAGIIYVFWMLFKEKTLVFSWRSFGRFVLAVLPSIVGGWIIAYARDNDSTGGMIVGFVVLIVLYVIVGLYLVSTTNKVSAKKPKYTVEDVKQEFQKCGYYNVSDRALEYLATDIYSPLNSSDLYSAGTVMRCYKWLCDSATGKIDKKSKLEIEASLGVPFDKIPLDENLPDGESSLKRTTLAKNYILQRDGLSYQLFKKYLDPSDEYRITFTHFVDEYISEHR